MHDVYRDRVDPSDPGAFELIGTADVTSQGLYFLDDGDGTPLSDEIEYCYYVVTRGSYGHPLLAGIDPLLNRSQKVCAQPNDTIPPCAPIVAIDVLDVVDCEDFQKLPCDFDEFSNMLSWSNNESDSCDNDIRFYEIYYSNSGADDSFELLATVTGTSFEHSNLPSYKGCYFIRAIDRSGNSSVFSETVCRDNCPSFELPNVITPNGDGFNDVLQAYNTYDPTKSYSQFAQASCIRFVESVKISFYNRWGKEVYNYESNGENSILINWDGRTFGGQRVPAGMYYYLAEVTFDVLDPAKATKKIKGQVHITY